MRRVAVLWSRDESAWPYVMPRRRARPKRSALAFWHSGFREPDDLNGVFEAMDNERPDAILIVSNSRTILDRKGVFDYAATQLVPKIYEDE